MLAARPILKKVFKYDTTNFLYWIYFAVFSVLALAFGLKEIVSYYLQQQEGMQVYTIKKGRHFSFPRQSKSWQNMEEVVWNVRFLDNSKYSFPPIEGKIDRDQYDWNKLCGVYFNFWNTRDDSAMIGWRYNPETELIELAPYYHVDGSRDMFKPIMYVSPGTLIKLHLVIDRSNKSYDWTLQANNQTAVHSFPFTHERKKSSVIQFYFGGNRTAPQDVSAEIRFQVTETES
jgi:hypothetical protein